MCLITFAYRSHPEYALVLLANRDEFYQRPSADMSFWEDHPAVLAGRDLEQQGTWLGLNTEGHFAAVTNYRDGRRQADNRLSRGNLTRTFLTNTRPAHDYLDTLEQTQHLYGDFNLLLGDSNGLYYLSNRSEQHWRQLKPGLYGMSNALLDTPWPKLNRVKSELSALLTHQELSEHNLMAIMTNNQTAADDQLPDTGISHEWEKLLSSSFIQAENYGTRAITLLLQRYNGATEIIEQNFDSQGPTTRVEQSLQLCAIGSHEPAHAR